MVEQLERRLRNGQKQIELVNDKDRYFIEYRPNVETPFRLVYLRGGQRLEWSVNYSSLLSLVMRNPRVRKANLL
jgi:hypothetical protein